MYELNNIIFKSVNQIIVIFKQKSPSNSSHKEFKYLTEMGEWQQDTNKTCSLKNHDLTVSFYSKYPS